MRHKLRQVARSSPLAQNLYQRFVQYRGKWEDSIGRRIWAREDLQSAAFINAELHRLIVSGEPFIAGKIGSNEQNLLMWAHDISIPTGIPFLPRKIHFDQTSNCAKNAGIVPRNVPSYKMFANLLDEAVSNVRVLGVWRQPGEYRYLFQQSHIDRYLCYFFDLEPFFVENPWTQALAGKRVLLVSPFSKSATLQQSRLADIWRNGLMPAFELLTFDFPYLISESVSAGLGWSDVYEDFERFAQKTDFDIAIIGCGGMSLLIAEQCRKMGRQAIHLGGSAQLLFGIRASRYEADPNYARLMNEDWVRPDRSETPPEARSIENGCYW